jgi:hypothetical protein
MNRMIFYIMVTQGALAWVILLFALLSGLRLRRLSAILQIVGASMLSLSVLVQWLLPFQRSAQLFVASNLVSLAGLIIFVVGYASEKYAQFRSRKIS